MTAGAGDRGALATPTGRESLRSRSRHEASRPHPLPYPLIGCAYSVAIAVVSTVVAVTHLPRLFRRWRPIVDEQLIETLLGMWFDGDEELEP